MDGSKSSLSVLITQPSTAQSSTAGLVYSIVYSIPNCITYKSTTVHWDVC